MSSDFFGRQTNKLMIFSLKRATEFLDLLDSLKLLRLNHALSYRLDDALWRSCLAQKIMRQMTGELQSLEQVQVIMQSVFKRRGIWTLDDVYSTLVTAPFIVFKPTKHIRSSAGWSPMPGFNFCDLKDASFFCDQNNASPEFKITVKSRSRSRVLVHAAVKATTTVACYVNLVVTMMNSQRQTLKTLETYLELANAPDTWRSIVASGLLPDQTTNIEGKILLRTTGTTNVVVGAVAARAIVEPYDFI